MRALTLLVCAVLSASCSGITLPRLEATVRASPSQTAENGFPYAEKLPATTPGPSIEALELRKRQVNSLCGYWSDVEGASMT